MSQTAVLGQAILGTVVLGFVPDDPVLKSPPAEPVYQLRARASDTLETLAIITEYRSLSYEIPMYRLGGFQVQVVFRSELLSWANNEGILEVVRDGETVFVGIVDHFESNENFEVGISEGILRGMDARSILNWRYIAPPAGQEFDEQIAVPAQSAIRHYVENNLTAPVDTARDFDNELTGVTFTIEAGSIGTNVDRQERYSNLLDVCFEIARSGDIWFEVTITSGGDYQLQFHATVDKTDGQPDAVVFSTALGTVESLEWTVNRRRYTNTLTLLGERVDTVQTVHTVTDLDNGSMFRRERVVSGGGVPTSATLTIQDATQWWTDFSEYPATPDTVPEGWTKRWDDINNLIIEVEDTGVPTGTTGGKALKMLERIAASGRMSLSSDIVGIRSTPVEIYSRCRFTAADFNTMNLNIHGGGTGGLNEDAYQVGLHGDPASDGTEWSFASLVNGGGNAAQTESSPIININTWYRVRLRRQGSLLQAKVWQDGTAEPGSFVNFEDHSHDTGWMGVGRWPVAAGGSGTTWFDWVGFAWNGDTAPSSLTDTVTIGSVTYTFATDMTVANNVLHSLSGEEMVANLAAAINDSGVEGTNYGTGTVAHPDVTAIADGNRLRIVAKDGSPSTIPLSTTLHNGEWDIASLEFVTLIETASVELAEAAERIRTYEVEVNQSSMPFPDAVNVGDIVTVNNRSLSLVDDRLVRAVRVALNQSTGERVLLELGDLPQTLVDIVGRSERRVNALVSQRR